jgi:hypothetical protein
MTLGWNPVLGRTLRLGLKIYGRLNEQEFR